ncbi:hypothetical protein V2W45_135689 [Cenococcum geophilum]
MRFFVLATHLGLIGTFVNASGCEQNYVRIYHPLASNDDLANDWYQLPTSINAILNTGCIATLDSPSYDVLNGCFISSFSDKMVWVCGFRLWRVVKSCDIQSQLNSALQSESNNWNIPLWQVFDMQPTGDVECS